MKNQGEDMENIYTRTVSKKKRPIIFYGAGMSAPEIADDLKDIGIEPVCFVDKNPKKQGTLFLGGGGGRGGRRYYLCGKPHGDFLSFFYT
ncbi:MAG: hypothetical protein LBJ72_10430 [Dysgonamonadaceae bacterium]|nr:hypothetical protein [Dysgonamonadaceae bacterium]